MDSESPMTRTFFFVVDMGSGGPGLQGHLDVTAGAPAALTHEKTAL